MWDIVTKKIGRVAVKEQGKSGILLFNHSLELVQVSASSYKWPKFTPISLQKCSCSAAKLRFLRLIGANLSSFSPSNQNHEQALGLEGVQN
jgi:hypothetical protein